MVDREESIPFFSGGQPAIVISNADLTPPKVLTGPYCVISASRLEKLSACWLSGLGCGKTSLAADDQWPLGSDEKVRLSVRGH